MKKVNFYHEGYEEQDNTSRPNRSTSLILYLKSVEAGLLALKQDAGFITHSSQRWSSRRTP